MSNYERHSNTTNNVNRDDTSPLGAPSTFDDINVSKECSKVENCNNLETNSITDRIEQLRPQSNSSESQRANDRSKCFSSISQSTTSASFCLQDDLFVGKEHKGIHCFKDCWIQLNK